jgi:hypothetical protein
LKKLKEKIDELCTNFDRKLFILFTKRLEYQYRVFEQEIYIVKLMQSILFEKRNKQDLANIEKVIQEMSDKFNENYTYVTALQHLLNDKKIEIDEKKKIVYQETASFEQFKGKFFDKYDNEKKALSTVRE